MGHEPPTSQLGAITACPRCLAALATAADKWRCTNPDCVYSSDGFPTAAGQPVLVDFERSVFNRGDYDEAPAVQPAPGIRFAGSVRTYTNRSLRDRFRTIALGINRMAERNSIDVLRELKSLSPTPRLLIIGGGTLGEGTRLFYGDAGLRVIVTDVYPSPNTSILADAHGLPFKDGVFDGVWIQAVLEHVLEPHVVVEQIHRVLKPGGVVYAETPFMMQVHEAAYDFTRFTLSGHRWLFRRFEQISGGPLVGAGSSTLWSVRFFWRALGLGDKASTLLTLPFFWLRYFDKLMRGHVNADAALGFFFLGRKTETSLGPKDIIAYYLTQ